ncbi:MAG TPA: hypothetical protein VL595_10250 [Pseudonocardia sp.]|nr:hypothetical protein [Pseudonocardia sp.]
MVSRADQRRGGPTASSVVSVADLLARDAPWSGAPSAVAVAKRPAGSGRSGSAASGPTRAGATRAGASGYGAPPAVSAPNADGPLRRFASAAMGPQWRFVTIAAAVLLTGLMANGVMLVAFHGPGHSTSAGSDEGGYPDNDPNQASRSYDDNGLPIDSALTPMFAAPGIGDLASANTVGIRLPMTLTSLGTAAPATSATGTSVPRAAPTTSTPVRAVAPSTGTGTGSVGTTARSSSGGGVGNVVRDTTSGLGKTVDDTASGLGRTLDKTATGLGNTVGNVADDLLGGSSKSKSGSSKSDSSSDKSSGGSSKSSGGLVGGLLGR